MASKILELRYCIDSHEKYTTLITKCDNQMYNLAEHIEKYYNSMTKEEMKAVVSKIMTEKDLRRFLMEYEMKNLNIETKDISIEMFRKIAQAKLDRYHYKAGGFCFGNNKWICHDSTSDQYFVDEAAIVFENTLHENYFYDEKAIDFVKDILVILNKISKNIKTTLHWRYSDRDKMYWILLKCREKK